MCVITPQHTYTLQQHMYAMVIVRTLGAVAHAKNKYHLGILTPHLHASVETSGISRSASQSHTSAVYRGEGSSTSGNITQHPILFALPRVENRVVKAAIFLTCGRSTHVVIMRRVRKLAKFTRCCYVHEKYLGVCLSAACSLMRKKPCVGQLA